MEKYFLSSKALYKILKDKGINNLFHANTALTSGTFIRQRALLSRGFVDTNGLTQTQQNSDEKDIKYGVWDDIFLDALDLHKKYKRPNKYGPVLFVLKLEILLSPSFDKVLITKRNPWYWHDNETWDDRYYSNLDDVKKDYLGGRKLDSQIMFTFRNLGNQLKLNKYLEFIGVDKPNVIVKFKSGSEKNIGQHVKEKLELDMKQIGLGHIEIKYRHKNGFFNRCTCAVTYTYLYNSDFQEFKKRFKTIP